MASPGPEKLYLVVEDYKRATEYELFFDRDEALSSARKLSDGYPRNDFNSYGGGEFLIFGEQGDEPSWHVEVYAISVTYTAHAADV